MTYTSNTIGGIEWCELTVDSASEISDFYQAVVGWKSEPVSMGDYNDFNMNLPKGNNTVTGICHARGVNRNFPPYWLLYVRVADLHASIAACKKRGGKILEGPRNMGEARFCVIQDPAGAVMGLIAN